jgi:hypothetical protein
MALPANISTVTVHGEIRQAVEGDPATGSITFAIPLLIKNQATKTILLPDAITVPLDGSGMFTVVLPATDDPDNDPTGWNYIVNENWAGGRSGLQIALPMTPLTVNWIDMVPTSVGAPEYMPVTVLSAHQADPDPHPGFRESVSVVPAAGAATTLTDLVLAYSLTLTAPACVLTFPTGLPGKSFTLVVTQDAAGSRTITWPASVDWSYGTPPTLTAGPGRSDWFSFATVDGTNWVGFIAAQDVR